MGLFIWPISVINICNFRGTLYKNTFINVPGTNLYLEAASGSITTNQGGLTPTTPTILARTITLETRGDIASAQNPFYLETPLSLNNPITLSTRGNHDIHLFHPTNIHNYLVADINNYPGSAAITLAPSSISFIQGRGDITISSAVNRTAVDIAITALSINPLTFPQPTLPCKLSMAPYCHH